MKKSTIITGVLLAALFIASCNSGKEEKVNEQAAEPIAEVAADTTSKTLLSVEAIDTLRGEIESLDIKPVEIATANLRGKIKQKWSKIHFYVKDNVVVKVKTYPYPAVSKRTEEFYANENGLVLVVIEDNGDGAKGKPKSELDKMYYYDSGKLVKEIANQKEAEHTIKESDAEELLSEFGEYIQLFEESTKK